MAADPEACRDGRHHDEMGRDLEEQPLVHTSYDPRSRWQRFKKAIVEPPKSTVSIYADIPFNHVEWRRHRNAAWRHRPQPMLFLRVAGGFWWQLCYVFSVSILVGLFFRHVSPSSAANRMAVAFNLTTFALSLLLVFRTNSSYSRWWEARTVWGAVVNLSRNFARNALVWLPERQARLALRWAMAAPMLLKCHLRFNASVRENVSHILLPQELEWVLAWTHRPNAAAHVMSSAVLDGRLDTNREQILMELVNTYIDCVGKCERIFKTPIPAAYTRHTSRYLMIYLTACPLVLWPSLGWWTLVAATLITFLLLGIENIGVQLEEPFRVLPLDDMCRGIEAALREIERQHNRQFRSHFTSWLGDPAALPRSSSESSLDSFQDNPADGPSEARALDRFHHIPAPAPLAAAAEVLRASIFRRQPSIPGGSSGPAGSSSGPGGHVLSPAASADLFACASLSLRNGSPGHSAAQVLPPLRRSGEDEAAAARTPSLTSPAAGAATPCEGRPHFPHHVHHGHRRLPQLPADLPAATSGGSGRVSSETARAGRAVDHSASGRGGGGGEEADGGHA